MKATGKLPGWLPLMNRVVRVAYKLGLRMGPVVVLTVRGRKSGVPRSTPGHAVDPDEFAAASDKVAVFALGESG